MKKATFGGGCFWCVEAVYQRVVGVISVKPGYAAGHTQNPTYKEVCSGDTGHAEVARIEFEVEYLRTWLTQRLTWDSIIERPPNNASGPLITRTVGT